MKTTLNKIKEHDPCKDGWKKLLTFLSKTEADDAELSLLTILESNGLRNALWALRAVDGFEKEKRLMACDFAEAVVHLTTDERCKNAIKVSRDFANGIATKEELRNAACAAAYAAAADAAYAAAACAAYAAADAADAAAYAAADAADAAAYAAYDAAADAAAYDAADSMENPIIIFKKYCK